MIKESKVLKVISYLLIPILILIIGLTFIYEIKKENIEYINNYFNSDEFVKYYINQLRNNMSYNASDNEVKDNKGYYICINGLDEEYVEDISSYNDYRVVPEKIDVRKVIDYSKNIETVNSHLVRANYVKLIEAEK